MLSSKIPLFWLHSFKKKILDDLTLFLHYCDYLPIEKGMALYLKKFEFSSPKDNLYQI
jgi:hypothetical protein